MKRVRLYPFYVYEHWRPDKDVCFWVGKGFGKRAYHFKRSLYYNNVVKKLARLGMCVEVRMVASGLNERQALDLEIERIAFWKLLGIKLTNITDGGQGSSGLKHSEETKIHWSLIRKGRKHTEETKAKMRAKAGLGFYKGDKHSEETCKKISERAHSPEVNAKIRKSRRNKGKTFTPEHRAKIGASLKGRVLSAETRAKISAARLGVPLSEEHRAKLRKPKRRRVYAPQ